jgi:hypothetical protein
MLVAFFPCSVRLSTEEEWKMKFNVGDRVQLRVIPIYDKAGRFMQARERGVVAEVTDKDYTVVFDDSPTPVAGMTESELEPASE